MWRSLPNALCNKTTGCLSQRKLFFLQLFGLVFLIHLLLFFVYSLGLFLFSSKPRFDISLSNKAATYVLLPLQKNVSVKNKKGLKSESSKKSKIISMQTYLDSKSKKSTKKSASPAKAIKSAKALPIKQETVSIKIQDEIKKSKTSKIKPATVVQEVIDLAIEQVEIVEKNEPKIQSELAVPDLTAKAEQETVASETTDQDFDENDVIFVGSQELQHHMIGAKIAQTVQQHWSVPIGIAAGTSCQMQVQINDVGGVVALHVIKSSGVLVYDSCARKTLKKIEYPTQVWNKTITIVLGSD